jgi:hypothetical protein
VVVQFTYVAGLHKESGDAVVDDLRNTADAAADHRRSARHRFEHGQAEQLGYRDMSPVARLMHRWQDEHRRMAVEPGKFMFVDAAGEADILAFGKVRGEVGIVPLRCSAVVARRACESEVGVVGQRSEQHVDALVRCEAPDEQDAGAALAGFGMEAVGVGATVDHGRPVRRRVQRLRREVRHRKETVEDPRQQSAPSPAAESVVGHNYSLAARTRRDRRKAAGCTAHVMGMDDVGAGRRVEKFGGDGMSRMTFQVEERLEHHDFKPVALRPPALVRAESHEPAVDVLGKGACQLERIAFAAAEEPF